MRTCNNFLLLDMFLTFTVTPLCLFQALSVITDYYFYKRWTSSVFNLLVYNVMGGGESHLYGTEGPLYYLRNGFNNFNFCFILALLFLAMLPIARKKYAPDLLVVVSPIYIWIAFMSLQPHKEERLVFHLSFCFIKLSLYISLLWKHQFGCLVKTQKDHLTFYRFHLLLR